MGAVKKRLVSVLIAALMVITSAAGVFAAGTDSNTNGSKGNASHSSTSVSKGTIKVEDEILKTSKGKINKDKDTITGLKEGNLVTITTAAGKTYRWVKTVKITSAKNNTIKWDKVKGATRYLIKIYDKNGKLVKTVTSKTNKYKSKKLIKKGYTVKVRPIKKKKGHEYTGALCKAKKVK